MSAPTVYASYAALIRHGDYHHQPMTPGAFQPYALNCEGEKQARQCVSMLTEFGEREQVALSDEIHTSSLLRAWQTADLITQQLQEDATAAGALVQTTQLTERCVGSLANLTLAEIEQIVRDDPRYENLPDGWKSNSHYCLSYPGAESLMQAGQRVADYIEQTMQQQQQRHKRSFVQIFVGHGAAFRHAAHHLGVLRFSEISQLSMHHARPLFLRLDADHSLHHQSGAWKQRANTTYTD